MKASHKSKPPGYMDIVLGFSEGASLAMIFHDEAKLTGRVSSVASKSLSFSMHFVHSAERMVAFFWRTKLTSELTYRQLRSMGRKIQEKGSCYRVIHVQNGSARASFSAFASFHNVAFVLVRDSPSSAPYVI